MINEYTYNEVIWAKFNTSFWPARILDPTTVDNQSILSSSRRKDILVQYFTGDGNDGDYWWYSNDEVPKKFKKFISYEYKGTNKEIKSAYESAVVGFPDLYQKFMEKRKRKRKRRIEDDSDDEDSFQPKKKRRKIGKRKKKKKNTDNELMDTSDDSEFEEMNKKKKRKKKIKKKKIKKKKKKKRVLQRYDSDDLSDSDDDRKQKFMFNRKPLSVKVTDAKLNELKKNIMDYANERKTNEIISWLNNIEKYKISVEQFKSSGIGKFVNTLRKKFNNYEIRDLSKKVVNKWREEVINVDKKPRVEIYNDNITSIVDENSTEDGTRDRAISLIATSFLKSLKDQEGLTITAQMAFDIAKDIEIECLKYFKNVGTAYNKHIRTIYIHCKQTDFSLDIYNGKIKAVDIPRMRPDQMVSEEKRKIREENQRKKIAKRLFVKSKNTGRKGMIKCEKCKGGNTTFNQVQTRSADEAMTVFCACSDCGHTWTL